MIGKSFANAFENIGDFFIYTIPRICSDTKYEIKWAWQRVFRGFDDRMYWGYYHDNAIQTLAVLKWLKEHRVGSAVVEECDTAGEKDIHKAWDYVLSKMITAFEAAIAKEDLFIVDENGKYNPEKTKAEYERLDKIWKEGGLLFIKYYNNLWD